MNLQFMVPFLYPAAALAFLLSMWRPQMGVYYLIVVLPLQTLRSELFSYPFGGKIIDIVLLGVLIGIWVNRQGSEWSEFPVRGILLLFTAYSYVSLWYGSFFLGWDWPISSASPRFSMWKGNLAELSVMCAVAFAAIKTRKQIETALLLMCLTVLVLSWDFFQTMSFRDVSHYNWDLRYSGVMGYAGANGLAAFEAMFILFLAGLFSLKMPSILKTVIPPTLLACGYGVLFAFSRGAYLGLACGVIVLGVLRRQFLMVVVVAALASSWTLLPTAVRDRIAGTYTQGESSTEGTLDASAIDRILIWQNALEIFADHPLMGTGYGTYAYIHPVRGFRDTHNFYIKVLVEQGAVGFLLFLTLLWKMFRQGYDLFRSSTDPLLASLGLGFAACVVGTVVVNIFGDRWDYLQVNSYLWISLALICRARLLSEEPVASTGQEPGLPLEAISLQTAN